MVVLRLGGFKPPGRIASTNWQRQLVAIAFIGNVFRNGWCRDDSVAPYATESWGSGAKTNPRTAENLALPDFSVNLESLFDQVDSMTLWDN